MAGGELERVALILVADGKGILAADATVPTLTRRFDTLGIKSTEQSRRTYREMLFTSPGAAEFISGVIMYDETIRQKSSRGMPLAEALAAQNVLPGIKVDTGAKPLAGSRDETVTEGLDGLRERLSEYRTMGARFAKWRAVIRIADSLPSSACVSANAHALARYTALCQEQELVPIVEPEVDIHCPEKAKAEGLLKAGLAEKVNKLPADQIVMLKLTLPEQDDFYIDFVQNPKVLKVVALSGGYSRDEGNTRLRRNHGVVASFSRALVEGLSVQQSAAEYDAELDASIQSIYDASTNKRGDT